MVTTRLVFANRVRHHGVMGWGRSILVALASAVSLAACIPGGGRAVAPVADPAPPPPATGRTTVADGIPDDLLADIELRAPKATPALSAASITTDARTVPAGRYTVRPGDTLRGIGNRTGAGSEAIARANTLAAPYLIRAGQVLTIPAGRYHEVREGETGIAIARAYRSDWSAIIAENALEPPYVLRIGQRLRLPGTAVPGRAPTIEEQAAAFTLDIDDIVTGANPAGEPAIAARPPAVPVTAAGVRRFAWPLDGPLVQRFGPGASGRVNEGINIAAPVGTPVRTAGEGTVVYAGNEIGLLGGLILIDHGGGWLSAYGHLDRVAVREGDHVQPGTIIATAGESGQVQTPQLHFELRQNRRPVDPLRYLPAR